RPAREEVAMRLERAADVVPRRLAREDEVVESAEQTKGEVPRQLGCDVADPRIVREPATEICVQRRAALAVDRLPLEDLGLTRYFASADLACWTISPNFAGSLTARSASTFRSRSISAAFRPAMNWLYDSPFARAPALMRMIQSFRNSRFLTLRSR